MARGVSVRDRRNVCPIQREMKRSLSKLVTDGRSVVQFRQLPGRQAASEEAIYPSGRQEGRRWPR